MVKYCIDLECENYKENKRKLMSRKEVNNVKMNISIF